MTRRKLLDFDGRQPVMKITEPCPVGCGRLVKRLVWRFGRWGCMACQRCGLVSERHETIRKAVASMKSSGSPAALSDRALILLAGLEER